MSPSNTGWQGDFAARLRDLETSPPVTVQRHDGKAAPRRFGVYRNNVFSSLVNTLVDGFPVTVRLVGEEFFKAMASHYTQHNLPQSPVMVFYGDGFGDFIDGFEPVASLPYLGDVARLEYTRRLALHAADTPVLSPEELALIPAEALLLHRIKLHPAVAVVASDFPIHSIWMQNTATPDRPIPSRGENVLVSRPEMDVELTLLPPGGVQFIDAIKAGQPLHQAAEALLEEGHGDCLDTLIRIALEAGTLIPPEQVSFEQSSNNFRSEQGDRA